MALPPALPLGLLTEIVVEPAAIGVTVKVTPPASPQLVSVAAEGLTVATEGLLELMFSFRSADPLKLQLFWESGKVSSFLFVFNA